MEYHPRAETLHREALDTMRVILPNYGVINFIISGLARNAKQTGRFERATQLAGAFENDFLRAEDIKPENIAFFEAICRCAARRNGRSRLQHSLDSGQSYDARSGYRLRAAK